jgi:hypothetical protein
MRFRKVALNGRLLRHQITQHPFKKETKMKLSTYYALTTTLTVFCMVAQADARNQGNNQAPCHQNANQNPYPTPYANPYAPNPYTANPYGVGGAFGGLAQPYFANPALLGRQLNVVPKAKATSPSTPETAVGRLHLLPSVETKEAPTQAPVVEPAPTKTADSTASTSEDNGTISESLKSLVGTWMAVSRHGDGELSTIELQLDKSGWAKLTVPGTDGKPSTIKRRVEFEDQELKLKGTDGALALGKLIEFNDRQLVLDRAGGQVTFVRP